ncbi:MAG: GFA family protein [Candidatus Latescibacteria bacterium]|nr:GFA family protein [Candidatus Latescibacterota bacterium]
MSLEPAVYEGSCLCGQVKVRVTGPPTRAGFCHCQTCRAWHAAPVNAFAAWPSKAVEVTQGEELLANYKSRRSNRHWCRECGSGMLNRVRGEWTVVYAMVLVDSGYVHQADCHIHCDEAVLDLHDGIPKFTGWPGSEPMEEPPQTRIRPAAS